MNTLNKSLLKYGIISVIGIILIYQFLPIGDYCTGLLNFLNSLFLFGLLIIVVVILLIRNFIRIRKGKEKVDFIPLALAIFFGLMWYFLVGQSNKKFWTEKALVGFIEIEGTPKGGTLVLFKNGSFGASYHRADYSCTYQGDYEINDSKLILKRNDLTELTNEVFMTEYLVKRSDSVLKPLKKGFLEIKISKIDGITLN